MSLCKNVLTYKSPLYLKPLAITVDFGSEKQRAMAANPALKSLLAKSIGAKKLPPNAWIVDATAGLGQDAFMMAAMGFRVTLIERSPPIAALLNNALSQVPPNSWAYPIVQRMTLVHGETKTWIQTRSGNNLYNAGLSSHDSTAGSNPAIIYIDPMFPANTKKSLSQKSIQILKGIIGDAPQDEGLLPAAQTAATHRIVVKRHRHSPYLDGVKPALSFAGKSHRFDVYFPVLAAQDTADVTNLCTDWTDLLTL